MLATRPVRGSAGRVGYASVMTNGDASQGGGGVGQEEGGGDDSR